MNVTVPQFLAYLGGVAAFVAIISNSIKIYEFISQRRKTSATKVIEMVKMPHHGSSVPTHPFLKNFQ